MITIPIYDVLILPGVTFYFKRDSLQHWEPGTGSVGEDVLFLFEKEEKPLSELTQEDFYPYGVMGTIEQLDADGTVRIRARARVLVHEFEIQDGMVTASAATVPEVADLPEE